MSKLIFSFPSWMTGGGIFPLLTNAPWYDEIPPETLDMEYFGNHSGCKETSSLVDKMIYDHIVLTDVERTRLARILEMRYLERWKRLYALMTIEYKPLENYNMIEAENTKTDVTVKTSHSQDHTVKNDVTGAVYGFNSSTESDATHNNGETTYDVDPEKNYDETRSTGDADKNERKLARSGNIGVTTSQQMAQSEIDLWSNYDIFEQIFSDIDTVLTSPLYE